MLWLEEKYFSGMVISERMLPRCSISPCTQHSNSAVFREDFRGCSHRHKSLSSQVPHWPTISVASCAAFCSNMSFICLMLNFSVSISFSFLSRTEGRRRRNTGINVGHIFTRKIKCSVSHLYRLSWSGHHPVAFRQRANQVQQQHVVTGILKEYFKEFVRRSRLNYLLQVSLDFVQLFLELTREPALLLIRWHFLNKIISDGECESDAT